MPRTLTEIAAALGATLHGSDVPVSGVAALPQARPGDLSLCLDRRSAGALQKTRAAAVLIPARAADLADLAPCPVLLVEQPRLALAKALELFYPLAPPQAGIQPGALVDAGARVEATARIEAGARVEAGASVGAGTLVGCGAVIAAGAMLGRACIVGERAVVMGCCRLGDRVVVKPGAVLGASGFGFTPDGGRARKIPQVGELVIEDDVEIGANTTVDRGTLGETRIGRGTKIDNLVQVGHNVIIGQNVLIAAQVGISGSARIEDGAVLGGQVGVADHVTIGAGAEVGAKSGVGTAVPAGAKVMGYPAVPVRDWLQGVFAARPRQWKQKQKQKQEQKRQEAGRKGKRR